MRPHSFTRFDNFIYFSEAFNAKIPSVERLSFLTTDQKNIAVETETQTSTLNTGAVYVLATFCASNNDLPLATFRKVERRYVITTIQTAK